MSDTCPPGQGEGYGACVDDIPLLTVSFGSFLHEQKRTSPVPKRRGRIAAPACAPFRNDRAGGSPMHSRAGR